MPFSFPSNPTVGQQSTQNGRAYQWSGSAWELVAITPPHTHLAGEVTSGVFDIARIPTGTSAATVCVGNDARLSDARVPTAHAASHASGGSDALSLAASQITSGTIAAARLPLATTTTAGGVIVPTSGNLAVDGSGNISAPFATLAQAQSGSSATAFMSAARTTDAVFNQRAISLISIPSATSGIATLSNLNAPNRYNTSIGSASGGGSFFVFENNVSWTASNPIWNGTTGDYGGSSLNWTRRFRFRIRFVINVLPTSNAVFRVLVGKTNFGIAAIGQLSAAIRGIGFEIRNNQLWLTTSNGTARTDTQAASVTLLTGQGHEVIIDSDGAGNATLLLNQIAVATSTGAPTSNDLNAPFFSIEGTTSDSAQSQIFWEMTPAFLLS